MGLCWLCSTSFLAVGGNVVNDLTSSPTALMMIRQYLDRGYTAETIARELGAPIKRINALVHEVERQVAEQKNSTQG